MKSFLFVLFFVFSSLTWAKLEGPQDLLGFYDVISIDDQRISKGPDLLRNLTEIDLRMSSFFHDLNEEPLDTYIINLFVGFERGLYHYHPFVFFKDLGEIHLLDDGFEYRVDQKVMVRKNWFELEEADHFLYLKVQEKDEYTVVGEIHFQSKSRNMYGKRRFELRRF